MALFKQLLTKLNFPGLGFYEARQAGTELHVIKLKATASRQSKEANLKEALEQINREMHTSLEQEAKPNQNSPSIQDDQVALAKQMPETRPDHELTWLINLLRHKPCYKLKANQELVEPIIPYYHQGKEGICGFTALMNIVEHLGLSLDSTKHLKNFLEGWYLDEPRGFIFHSKTHLKIGGNLFDTRRKPQIINDIRKAFAFYLSLDHQENELMKIHTDDKPKILASRLKFNAVTIKKLLDQGKKLLLIIDAKNYSGSQSGLQHGLAIVGYKTDASGRMFLQTVDSNRGYSWWSLELLSASLHSSYTYDGKNKTQYLNCHSYSKTA